MLDIATEAVVRRRQLIRRVAVAVTVLIALVVVRIALEPHRAAAVPLRLTSTETVHVREALAASALDRKAFIDAVAGQRVLLVGESHFMLEPQTFVTELAATLHARDGRRAVLLLELPAPMQESLDRYLSNGDEQRLNDEWRRYRNYALPYQPIVRWVRAHPEAVSSIVADDERPLHTRLMRMLLTDTRNATMAQAVATAAREHPADRIIVFGGRSHMMKGGRYLYDSATRSPIGARLKTLPGAPRDVAAIWLFAGDAPAAGTWATPEAISFARPAGALPIRVLQDEAVFGVSTLREVADYAVYLGPATPTKG